MTAIATLPVLVQTGNHAGRPAASAVGSGAVYFCTTHSLIYQQIGGSWGTFWTFAASGLTDPMTTRGDMIVRNASNVTARLGRGSAGTYLGSDGTDLAYAAVTDAQLSTSDITTNNASTSKHGFTPKYPNDATKYLDGTGAYTVPAGSAGGLALLEQHTASTSAQLDFTSFISSTYDDYLIELVNVLPATNGTSLSMRIGTGGGPTYDTGSNYGTNQFRWTSGASAAGGGTTTTAVIDGMAGVDTVSSTASNGGVVGTYHMYGPQDTTVCTNFWGQTTVGSINGFRAAVTGVTYSPTTAVTALRFYFSSGNIASGIIRIYGIAK